MLSPYLFLLPLLACTPRWSDTGSPTDIDADGDGVRAEDDCDDADALVAPGLPERCNDIDDDCDGAIDDDDDDVSPAPAWNDADGDGYGGELVRFTTCVEAESRAALLSGGDCNDTDATIHPGADERCNESDDDCNGSIDDSPVDGVETWLDVDGDGYGRNTPAILRCSLRQGEVGISGDCEDLDGTVHPDAVERCNDVDDNCDGSIDDADPTVEYDDTHRWFADADNDGWGSTTSDGWSCVLPSGTANTTGDCDDSDPTRWPGAAELCNDIDDDCDGLTDDEPNDGNVYYVDLDQDGYGNGAQSRRGCTPPPGTVTQRGDCNDLEALANPSVSERCDGFDNNCDGLIDDLQGSHLPGASEWYLDLDDDGDGDATLEPETWCVAPDSYVDSAADCNDTDPNVNSHVEEVCNDGIDNNCDGGRAPCGPTGPVDGASFPMLHTSIGIPTSVLGAITNPLGDGVDHLWVNQQQALNRVVWQPGGDPAEVLLRVAGTYYQVSEADFDGDGVADTLAVNASNQSSYRYPMISHDLRGSYEATQLPAILVEPSPRLVAHITQWPPHTPGGQAGIALSTTKNGGENCTLHSGPFVADQELLSGPHLTIINSRTSTTNNLCDGGIGDLDGDGVGEVTIWDDWNDGARHGSVVVMSSADLHAIGTGTYDLVNEAHLLGNDISAFLAPVLGSEGGDYDGDGRVDLVLTETLDHRTTVELLSLPTLPVADALAHEAARTVLAMDFPAESVSAIRPWPLAGATDGLWIMARRKNESSTSGVYGFEQLPEGRTRFSDAFTTSLLGGQSFLETADVDGDSLHDVLFSGSGFRIGFGETL